MFVRLHMCLLLDRTLSMVPKVVTGTHWNKTGDILSNYRLKQIWWVLKKEETGFCHWTIRLMGWGLRNDVMYFIHGSFTLIPPWLTESIIWVSSFWGPEGYITVQAVRYYAWCVMLHVIEFLLENPCQTQNPCVWTVKFQGIFLLSTWEALYIMFETQIIETKSSLLGKLFRAC